VSGLIEGSSSLHSLHSLHAMHAMRCNACIAVQCMQCSAMQAVLGGCNVATMQRTVRWSLDCSVFLRTRKARRSWAVAGVQAGGKGMLRVAKEVNSDVVCRSGLRSIYEAHTIWRLAFWVAKKGSGLAAKSGCLSWWTKAPGCSLGCWLATVAGYVNECQRTRRGAWHLGTRLGRSGVTLG
jgi:hypothetical protein